MIVIHQHRCKRFWTEAKQLALNKPANQKFVPEGQVRVELLGDPEAASEDHGEEQAEGNQQDVKRAFIGLVFRYGYILGVVWMVFTERREHFRHDVGVL